jgi:serine/threonine protein kinase
MPEQPFTGSLKPGTTLDKYEVRERMAVGGMAILYKAYDPTLDRYVAIKQIAPHLSADEKFTARFRIEAQTLARLSGSQPNIVHVHELIQQEGQLYLVMEYVEGTTLRTLMDRGPVPLQTAMGVLLSTALGLRAMHVQGVVHRDLTPANIMMAKDGALKITDFGLIGHSGGKTSLPMGTTKYMAPEMFTGMPVDPRADLYSLGIIAYEMLAGPEKFGEAFRDVLRDEKAQQVRWMHWHSNANLHAPPLKDLQPGIPPLISKIVERLMDKDPARRFASADQVVRWVRKIFVMTVQGKSITVSDSESMEREMETEAAPLGTPPARPGMAKPSAAKAPAAASAKAADKKEQTPVESADKTAPLPKKKWKWKHWVGYVVAPAVVVIAGLVLADVYLVVLPRERHQADAKAAQQEADALFNDRKFGDAARAYEAITDKFKDIKDATSYASRQAAEARAEEALLKNDWSVVDSNEAAAENRGADTNWINDFKGRYLVARDIFENIAKAKALEQDGKFEEAAALLTSLVQRNPDLKDLGLRIAEMRRKITQNEYRELIRQGRDAMNVGDYTNAGSLLNQAVLKAESISLDTTEALNLLKKVISDSSYATDYADAEKAMAAKDYGRAFTLYKKCFAINPVEEIKSKMNRAKSLELMAVATPLLDDAASRPQAYEILTEVLKYDPQNAVARKFTEAYKVQMNLQTLIKAGEDAMADKKWAEGKSKFEQAVKLVPADQTTLKETLDGKIAECTYNFELESGDADLAAKKFDDAKKHYEAAKAIKETPEVTDKLATCETEKMYFTFFSSAKSLLAGKQFTKAFDEARKAQKVKDTDEVRELISEIDYQRYLENGKELQRQGKLKEARAAYLFALKAAEGHRDTTEVKGRIDMVTKMIKALPPDKTGTE